MTAAANMLRSRAPETESKLVFHPDKVVVKESELTQNEKPLPLNLGLFAVKDISKNELLCKFTGEYVLQKDYEDFKR